MLKVSILCLTYNQKKYIRQSLESFVNQQTNFDFEILINDDASTDGTKDIIEEFRNKYPKIIKPVYQVENQYSKGKRNFFSRFLLDKAKGQYIATCEGDDYWTEPNKLQIQVDFLDDNPDYSLCFHQVKVTYENKEKNDFIFPDVNDESWYTKYELLKSNYIHTSSVMYRSKKYTKMPVEVSPADWYLNAYHAKFGKIKFIKKVMSVYRKHDKGIWRDYDIDRDRIWAREGIAHLTMQHELLDLYSDDPKAKKIILSNILQLIEKFISLDIKLQGHFLQESLTKYPEYGSFYIHNYKGELRTKDNEIRKLWKAINEQNKIIKYKEELAIHYKKESDTLRDKFLSQKIKNTIKKVKEIVG